MGTITRTAGAGKVVIRPDQDIGGKSHLEVLKKRFRTPYIEGTEILFGRGQPKTFRREARVIFAVRITGKGFVEVLEAAMLSDWEDMKREVRRHRNGFPRG